MSIVDMTRTETSAAVILALAIVTLGVWPTPLLNLIAGSVGRIAGLFGA
jgi:NADH-quinone oxidoreductase subunit M